VILHTTAPKIFLLASLADYIFTPTSEFVAPPSFAYIVQTALNLTN